MTIWAKKKAHIREDAGPRSVPKPKLVLIVLAAGRLADGGASTVFVADGEPHGAGILTDIGQIVPGTASRVREEPGTVSLHLELDVALFPVRVAAVRLPALGRARSGLDGEEGERPVLVHLGRLDRRFGPLEITRAAFGLVVVGPAGLAGDDREVGRHGGDRSARRRNLGLGIGRAESEKRNSGGSGCEQPIELGHDKELPLSVTCFHQNGRYPNHTTF